MLMMMMMTYNIQAKIQDYYSIQTNNWIVSTTFNAVIVQSYVDPSINDTTYGQQQPRHHLLQYINFEARIAVLDRSITMAGSKRGIPPFLKKFGSAATNPKVEASMVWT